MGEFFRHQAYRNAMRRQKMAQAIKDDEKDDGTKIAKKESGDKKEKTETSGKKKSEEVKDDSPSSESSTDEDEKDEHEKTPGHIDVFPDGEEAPKKSAKKEDLKPKSLAQVLKRGMPGLPGVKRPDAVETKTKVDAKAPACNDDKCPVSSSEEEDEEKMD